MKTIDPLMGYRVLNGNIFFQLGLLIALSFLLIAQEFQFKDNQYSILVLFLSHLCSSAIDIFTIILKVPEFATKRVVAYTLNLVAALLYQGSIIYSCSMYYTEVDKSLAKKWIQIELLFWICQLATTVSFLAFSFLFRLEILKAPSDTLLLSQQNQEQKPDDQDFLQQHLQKLQLFAWSAVLGSSSIIIAIFLNENHTQYFLWIEGILFLLFWTCEAIDQFTKLVFPREILQTLLLIGIFINLGITWTFTGLSNISIIAFYYLVIITSIIISLAIIVCLLCVKPKSNTSDVISTQKVQQQTKQTYLESNLQEISFDVDFYAITYLGFYYLSKQNLQSNQNNQQQVNDTEFDMPTSVNEVINPQQEVAVEQQIEVSEVIAAKYFSQAVFIFVIQSSLIFLVFWQFRVSSTVVEEPNNFGLLMTKIFCAILLHFQLQEEVKQSIIMMDYAQTHIDSNDCKIPMYLVGLMKFIGAFFTEIINILLIAQQTDGQSVIMNFVAFGVIAEIDNLYAGTLVADPIKQSIDTTQLLVTRDPGARRGFIVEILTMLYQSYYYYYMPLTIALISLL